MALLFAKIALQNPQPMTFCRKNLAVTIVIFILFMSQTIGKKTVSSTAQTPLCAYTVIVNEFDVSKCPTVNDHAQADWVELNAKKHDGTFQQVNLVNNDEKHTQRSTISKNRRVSSSEIINDMSSGYRTNMPQTGRLRDKGDMGGLSSLVKDMESKLLDEMVRNRELNATLARHELLLNAAQTALESYKANFSSVFRTMMLMERKLQNQRKINKSLDKKLSNVILDVVEVNNVLTQKLPTGDAAKSRKKFAVESSSQTRSCQGLSPNSNMFKDCKEVYDAGHHKSDVYYIKPIYSACPIPVWCDMDSPKGGWLVFQRRYDGTLDFNRQWDTYRSGFGDVSGEHWLGNDNIFLLTNQGHYQMRIDLWDFSGNRVHALYSEFKIDGERDNYKLHVSGFSGSAQDSLHRHNNRMFSTTDRDNDVRREASCAQEWEAGWWFDHCWFALLNGPYQNRSDVSWRGLAWNAWKREQLKASEMKIRPLNDQQPPDNH